MIHQNYILLAVLALFWAVLTVFAVLTVLAVLTVIAILDLADLVPLVDDKVLEACQVPDWGYGCQDVDPFRPLDVWVPDHVGGAHVEGDPVHHLLLQLLGEGAGELAVVAVIALYHEQVLQVGHVLLLPLPPPGHSHMVFGVVVGDEGRPHSVEHGRGQLAEHLGGGAY